ncbi:hypothetical protein P4233_31175 [Pseudomonas aeruginosa]|nr:hypothetical protein [Pseudomonas aeruginosa]
MQAIGEACQVVGPRTTSASMNERAATATSTGLSASISRGVSMANLELPRPQHRPTSAALTEP